MNENGPRVCPANRAEWREWLLEHHGREESVWVLYHKKATGIPRVSWKDAVEEALCFGWIDGRAKPIDDARYMQHFCRRKPGSTWSKINKESVARLTAQGLMTPAGLAAIETARQNGSWNVLDEVEEGIMPADLQTALAAAPMATGYFDGLSRSDRRNLLQWLVLAKRIETRQKRIAEIVDSCAAGRKPKPIAR